MFCVESIFSNFVGHHGAKFTPSITEKTAQRSVEIAMNAAPMAELFEAQTNQIPHPDLVCVPVQYVRAPQ